MNVQKLNCDYIFFLVQSLVEIFNKKNKKNTMTL
jgi:hypothetical protein